MAEGPETGELEAAVWERLRSGRLEVPMLPQVAMEVMRAAGSGEVDAPVLAATIHRDPALAARVLRIANSPSYQPRMPIVSLQQAVTRLGMSTLGEIAMAASVQGGVFKVPGFDNDLRAFWRHALASAAFAKEIARTQRANVETAFLCGLLHTIGRPFVLQLAVDAVRATGLKLVTPADRAEVLRVAGALATAAGALVAAEWKLPVPVRMAIAHHEDPVRAPENAPSAALAQMAGNMATMLFETVTETGVHETASTVCLELLNLYADQLDAIVARREHVRTLVDSLTVA